MKEFIAGKNEAGQRFDKYLKKILPNASTGFIYKMLRKKNFTLNGKKAAGTEILKNQDVIKIFLSDDTFEKFSVDEETLKKNFNFLASLKLNGLKVIYEDEDILAASKPINMLSQMADPDDISANERLLGYLIGIGALTLDEYRNFKPSVCNRLDRNTSGIILMGKSLSGLQKLSEDLRERTIKKYYMAWVCGDVSDEMLIEGYLTKDAATNKVLISDDPISAGSAHIKTEYRPVKKLSDRTLLEVHLITGKSHQIRAHLASIGHPIIGDYKYGDRKINDKYKEQYGIKSQLLHAHRVVFEDGMEIKDEIPDVFKKLM